MSEYRVTEGAYCTIQATFDHLEEALDYISDKYGADNVIDQLVQIEEIDREEETKQIYTCLEVYDLITERK